MRSPRCCVQELPKLEILPAAPLGMLLNLLSSVVTRLLLAVVLAQLVIAGADMFWLWRQHLRQLRMSRSDIKDETKETDGDPAIKMRIRRLRMRRARQRMLAAVPKATVVVTNPTHYAVALTYDSKRAACRGWSPKELIAWLPVSGTPRANTGYRSWPIRRSRAPCMNYLWAHPFHRSCTRLWPN